MKHYREAIAAWREFAKGQVFRDDLHRCALDVLSDHFGTAGNPEFDALDEDERAAYLAHLAEGLEEGLVKFVGYWMLNDATTVPHWKATQ